MPCLTQRGGVGKTTIASHYPDVIIDGPPRVNEIARSASLASDVVLIPVLPSPYAIWAAKEIGELLGAVSAFKEKQKSAFVINRKITNTAIGRDGAEVLTGLGLPVLSSTITQRVAFAKSVAGGVVVMEIDPQGPAAVADQWVENRATDEGTTRLTLGIPESLHRRIKAQYAMNGGKVVDVIKSLLEDRFPEK